MKKTRRRGSRRRHRNPMHSRGTRRARRRSSSRFRLRNPLPIVNELFGSDMLSVGAGIVTAGVGTTMLMNRLVAGNAQGQRSFDLPLVDYTMLANPATAGSFYQKNAWVLAIYKIAIGGAAGWALKNQAPRFARGVMLGTVATAISDVLRNTGVLNASGQLQLTRQGTGRMYSGNGVGYLPGTNPMFTGPAQSFLTRNNVPRPGMGARVGPSTMSGLVQQTEGAFRGAN